jgi:hypothetical protein
MFVGALRLRSNTIKLQARMFGKRRKAAKAEEARREVAVRDARSVFDGLLDADGALTPEGVGQLFMYMGERSDVRSAILSDLWIPMLLALAQGGRFIAADKTSLLLHEDESALYDCRAYLLREVIDRELRGSSQGISVPLGHGVRYRVGSARGHMVTIGSHWTDADEGALTLTGKRLVYHGERQTIEFPLGKLASLNVYGDAIAVGVTNRKTNSHFRVGTPALVAGLIQGAVSHEDIVVMHLQLEEASGLSDQGFQITKGSAS